MLVVKLVSAVEEDMPEGPVGSTGCIPEATHKVDHTFSVLSNTNTH